MSEEFDRALATGIKTETDGMEMYRNAAKNAKNNLGRALFESLVKEEQKHLKALKERMGEDWKAPAGSFRGRIRTVFQEAGKDIKERLKADPGDVEAIKIALEFERKGYHRYKENAETVSGPKGKELFEWLAGEENEHFKVLQDLHEYLEHNYSWFTAEDCPILDGGA
ncbi:MAG: ferritin family protein [Planctomycetes bacterium]|nr:ferritin family protein [Planctomycetota bacterium]